MRRKIPEKAKLPKEKPLVVKIDPKKLSAGIVLPKISYEVITKVENDTVYDGMIIPIPRVMIYFLTHTELIIFSTILEDSIKEGCCTLTVRELSARLKITLPTISASLYRLRKMGLLLESPNGKRGAGRTRRLNYSTIQHLNDLVEGEDPGIYVRIRKATRKTAIENLTKEDIQEAYDNKVLPPDHDEWEEEEYD